jgi:transcriptional regulator with XRE-family HTH domain
MSDEKNGAKILGRAIKELRKQKGLSQRKLASLAKMNHVYIYKIEKGETSPTLRTLQRIADALGGELTATIGGKSLTREEVAIEDETLIKLIISYANAIKDTEKREKIIESLKEAIPTEFMTYALDLWTGRLKAEWLALHSLRYDIDANSYKLTETKEYAPVEEKDGYLAVKIEQPPPHSRFDKDDIVVFKREDKITNPDETVLIKFTRDGKEKIFLGTLRDFMTANPEHPTMMEKYRITYIIHS